MPDKPRFSRGGEIALPKPIPASYDSMCDVCGFDIAEGLDEIRPHPDDDGSWVHAEPCYLEARRGG